MSKPDGGPQRVTPSLRGMALNLALKYEMDFEVSTKPATVRSDGDTTPLVERITTALSQVVEDCARVAEDKYKVYCICSDYMKRNHCLCPKYQLIGENVAHAIRRLASGEGEKT